MQNDDANVQRMSLNHSHPSDGAEAHDDALLVAEYGPEHEAMVALAATWSATLPSAERLATFTRQLPTQEPAPQRDAGVPLVERMRSRAQREANIPPATRHRGGGRLLATVAAAVVIVGLLATALLRFAPGHTGRPQQHQIPAATATATPITSRQTEEPSNGVVTGSWTTVSHTLLIPAPSDGNAVYQTTLGPSAGSGAQVSHDGGVTWSALTLPTFKQPVVQSVSVDALRISDRDAQVVLLSLTLMTGSAPASDCPPGSKWPAPDGPALHGGIDASGYSYCIANFASHDGGASWQSMSLPKDITYPPAALDPNTVWQVGNTLFGVDSVALGLKRLTGASLLVSHDLGVTWAYNTSLSPESSAFLCSVVPSPSEGALYVLTNPSYCPNASNTTPFTVWRSADDGGAWQMVSTISTSMLLLFSSTPATNQGTWLYGMEFSGHSSQPVKIIVSADDGVTWSEAPTLPPGENSLEEAWPLRVTLNDGSLVVRASMPTTNPTNPLLTPTPMHFLAWRPGDAQWRTLATPITMHDRTLTGLGAAVTLTHGGPQAIDTLWVTDQVQNNNSPQSATFTTYRWSIQ